MYIMLMIFMLLFLLNVLMYIMNMLLCKVMVYDREKSSPFECGFDVITSPRLPFSNNFFVISLLFILFDVEIALILPMNFIWNFYDIFWLFVMMFFLYVLFMGTLVEWMDNSFKWVF